MIFAIGFSRDFGFLPVAYRCGFWFCAALIRSCYRSASGLLNRDSPEGFTCSLLDLFDLRPLVNHHVLRTSACTASSLTFDPTDLGCFAKNDTAFEN
jgi:hypothetical protein